MPRVAINKLAAYKQNNYVKVIAGRQLYVYETGTTNEVQLYDAQTGGNALTQPVECDADGQFRDVWAEQPGTVDLVAPGDLIPTQTVELVAGIDQTDVPTKSGTETITGEWAGPFPRVFNVKVYGALGAGALSSVTETSAIQDAIDAAGAAGGGIVHFPDQDTYTVEGSGVTRTYTSTGVSTYEYALSVPDNVTLDLAGSTLTLKAGETSTVLLTNADATNSGIAITGKGTIDGNNVQLSNRPLVWFEGVDGLDLDVTFRNTHRSGLYVIDSTDIRGPVRSYSAVGMPIQFGSPNYPISDSAIGAIESYDVTGDFANLNNFPGNPVYIVAEHTTIESIKCRNTTAGIKIADFDSITIGPVMGEQVGVDDVTATLDTTNSSTSVTNVTQTTKWTNGMLIHGNGIPAGTTVSSGAGTSTMVLSQAATATATGVTVGGSTGNSGLKIQSGSVGANARAKVGAVTMSSCDGAGLYMDQCSDCEVASYTGESNATWGAYPDVWIGGTRDKVHSILSKSAGGVAVNIRDTGADAALGKVVITDPNRKQIANTSAFTTSQGTGRIEDLLVSDASSYMLRGFNISNSAGLVTVGRFKISGYSSAAFNWVSGTKLAQKDVVLGPPATGRVVAALTSFPQRGSSATVGLNNNSEVVQITGTTTITSITATYAGHIVVLQFTGALTVTDGSNLKLAGDLTTAANTTLMLVCDGTNWIEISRSVN